MGCWREQASSSAQAGRPCWQAVTQLAWIQARPKFPNGATSQPEKTWVAPGPAKVETIMFELVRLLRVGCAVLFAAILLVTPPLPSYAATGSVRINLVKAGFIVGASGGGGILHFRGRNYPLNVGGISVGTIGAARADLVGRAYNLRRAADIVGTYTAVSSSVAVAAGAKVVRLQNSNGVVLELRGPEVGLEASASLSGMSISMR